VRAELMSWSPTSTDSDPIIASGGQADGSRKR
jgi:hypothetical protein